MDKLWSDKKPKDAKKRFLDYWTTDLNPLWQTNSYSNKANMDLRTRVMGFSITPQEDTIPTT
jgi:hypothetical protein